LKFSLNKSIIGDYIKVYLKTMPSPEALGAIKQLAAHEQACTGFLFVMGKRGPLYVDPNPIGIRGDGDVTHRSPTGDEYEALAQRAGIKKGAVGGIYGVYGGENAAIYLCSPASKDSDFSPAKDVEVFNRAAKKIKLV
jgi:hypothetical protein